MFIKTLTTTKVSFAEVEGYSNPCGYERGTIVRGLLEKYRTFAREKETGLLGALGT
jgi:hypothetical protein